MSLDLSSMSLKSLEAQDFYNKTFFVIVDHELSSVVTKKEGMRNFRFFYAEVGLVVGVKRNLEKVIQVTFIPFNIYEIVSD